MRVLITGAPGSGTSTLGRALADRLGLVHVETDDFQWEKTDPPYQFKRTPVDRTHALVAAIRREPGVVVSGSVIDWGGEIEDCFDAVVYRMLDTHIRLARIEQRDMERFGRVNPAFLTWAAQYDHGKMDGRSKDRHEQWLAQRACNVINLVGDAPLRELVESVMRSLAQTSRPRR